MNTFNVKKAYGTPDLIGVLLSGGIDSTTAFVHAVKEVADVNTEVVAISINYGQRHINETIFAQSIASSYDKEHRILNLDNIIPAGTMLKDANQLLPNTSYAELEGVSPTYVPFRNGLMLAAAASFLIGRLEQRIKQGKIGADGVAHLFAGMHAEDAAAFAYPDCTPEFAGSMANALWMGSYGKLRLITPLINLAKHEIVEMGDSLDVDYSMTWSCYNGGEFHCGTCPTCRARKEAFEISSVDDPTHYLA